MEGKEGRKPGSGESRRKRVGDERESAKFPDKSGNPAFFFFMTSWHLSYVVISIFGI